MDSLLAGRVQCLRNQICNTEINDINLIRYNSRVYITEITEFYIKDIYSEFSDCNFNMMKEIVLGPEMPHLDSTLASNF